MKLSDGKTLSVGEWFRTNKEPGKVFKFTGALTSERTGLVSICAYGGDKSPNGRRSFRAFDASKHQFKKTKNPQGEKRK